MTSTDQELTQSTTDQSQEGNSDEVETQSQSLEDDNTQEETISKAEYKKLQAEYTKSRQELSELKKTSELSDEDKAAIDFIKRNWFVTKQEIAQEAKFKDIIAANPDLKPYETAIKEIADTKNIALEDVIEKYGFKSKDKLAKAKSQWDVKWTPEKKDKPIAEMTSKEYADYKKKMWWTGNRGSFS